MDEADVFPEEAADVGMQAIKDGVAGIEKTRDQLVSEARKDIMDARSLVNMLMEKGVIKQPPLEMIEEAVNIAVDAVK